LRACRFRSANPVIGESEQRNRTAARHVANGAVRRPGAIFFRLSEMAGGASPVVGDGGLNVGVRVMASHARQRSLAGLVALTGGETDGGETDAGRVLNLRLGRRVFAIRRPVAFGTEGDVPGAPNGRFLWMVYAFAMAALAMDARLGGAGGMAGETALGVGVALDDAEGDLKTVGGLRDVAGREAQPAREGVLTDTMFHPAAVPLQQQCAGEVAGAK